MRRTIYSWVIAMHPPGFRELFGEELIAIFDQLNGEFNGRHLIWDALQSLGRQWLFRRAWWMPAIAALAAAVEVVSATLMIVAFRFSQRAMEEAGGVPGTRLLMLEVAMLVICVVLAASITMHLQLKKRQHQNERKRSL